VIIPKAIAEALEWEIGDFVGITMTDDGLLFKKIKGGVESGGGNAEKTIRTKKGD